MQPFVPTRCEACVHKQDQSNLHIHPVACLHTAFICALERRHACRLRNLPRRPEQWRIRSACLKLHPRRVTALAFPPGSINLVCSADKKGLIGIWDFEEVPRSLLDINVVLMDKGTGCCAHVSGASY